ncbi:ankyrin repeat-containing domain protein [Phaeosphaeria sp. MPI-PUGE-AT-0046c]|nr:ankyrin repeat-containing domain protein [Phaeosphaeria sp. MPI-PUGE-AT-0046c]
MAQITEDDLKDLPGNYDSCRKRGEVLIGEDDARLLIEACRSGDDATLESLLLQPHWIDKLFQRVHSIYYESRPSRGPDDIRQVSAAPTSHLERALETAAESGHASAVSSLLSFAKKQGVNTSDLITRTLVRHVIQRSPNAAVLKVLGLEQPSIVSTQINHGAMPLFEAVRQRKTAMAAVLLELGADPFQPFDHPITSPGAYRSSLMYFAAYSDGPRMTEMLLECKLPIAGTSALHNAAKREALDIMRVLIQHGADVNEALKPWRRWTPMHFAASEGRLEAMKMLEENGARLDVEDQSGKTPKQLLEERSIKS